MAKPTTLTITPGSLPWLCRLWHRWRLVGPDHLKWTYWECARCGGRRAVADGVVDVLDTPFDWCKGAVKA